jgi:hypothetical protein
MISFYKLEQIIKIWMESIKEKDEKWYKTVGFADKEEGWIQEYALSTTEDRFSDKYKPRTVYTHCIKGMPSDAKQFEICLDNKDNPIFIISNEYGVQWKDNAVTFGSKGFSNADINKLRSMIIESDKTIEDYLREHPKFDMDENHGIIITDIIFKEPERIEIRFASNNRIFNRNNKLYVGFDSTDEDGREWNYVFKVTEKHISVRHSYSGTNVFTTIPFKDYAYTAEFHGYFRPTEEEILNATFRWVISEEIIKQANKEACYT